MRRAQPLGRGGFWGCVGQTYSLLFPCQNEAGGSEDDRCTESPYSPRTLFYPAAATSPFPTGGSSSCATPATSRSSSTPKSPTSSIGCGNVTASCGGTPTSRGRATSPA